MTCRCNEHRLEELDISQASVEVLGENAVAQYVMLLSLVLNLIQYRFRIWNEHIRDPEIVDPDPKTNLL